MAGLGVDHRDHPVLGHAPRDAPGAVLALFDAGLALGERRISAYIGEYLIYDMRAKVFRHVQAMPIAFFSRTQTGALISRLNNDIIGAQQAFTDLLSNIRHFTLPAVALAISSLAIVARVTRASVREEGRREHVQTAVSRGIPGRQLIQRHILRNAAIPITTISGITIASLIAVAAVVEVAFSLNGLGAYLVASAQDKDLAVVQGISLVLVTAFVLVNLFADVLYAVLDPRVKLGTKAA